jgi:hypothetical protein
MLSKLKPAISHVYCLDYDPTQGRTIVRNGASVDRSQLEEVIA